ncbi:MAG: alpha/beta fold hydrolase [Oscillochloris sp.]|nr:alpha/beta fold hydrolase [Oscillochloris sp.]
MFVSRRGNTGPALLCLHGAGGNHRHWGRLLADLAPQMRGFALDLPGHGRSAPLGRTTIAEYAHATLAALDSLELEQAILCGHSMGGAIALMLALHAPHRVAGLILIGSAARLRVAPPIIAGFEHDPRAAVDQLVELIFAANAPAELRAAARAEYLQCPPAIFRDDFRACDGFDLREHLAQIQAPALVIAGDADRLVPRKLSDEVVAGIAGARQVILAHVGHTPMLEAPDAVAAAITDGF